MSKAFPNNFFTAYNNKTYAVIRTFFQVGDYIKSHLVRPKDTVDPAKQDDVVYRIPSVRIKPQSLKICQLTFRMRDS